MKIRVEIPIKLTPEQFHDFSSVDIDVNFLPRKDEIIFVENRYFRVLEVHHFFNPYNIKITVTR